MKVKLQYQIKTRNGFEERYFTKSEAMRDFNIFNKRNKEVKGSYLGLKLKKLR